VDAISTSTGQLHSHQTLAIDLLILASDPGGYGSIVECLGGTIARRGN